MEMKTLTVNGQTFQVTDGVVRTTANGILQDMQTHVLPVVDAAVTVKEQTLTESQKKQARQNIGAIAVEYVDTAFENYYNKEEMTQQAEQLRYAVLNAVKEDYYNAQQVGDMLGERDERINGLEAAVGDMETALNSIIVIQSALIGDTIAFTIGGISFTALRGMTWSQWCDSAYNELGRAYVDQDGIVYDSSGDVLALDEAVQYGTTVLIDGAAYLAL